MTRQSLHLHELAREPAGQIDEVHALIDQLASPGHLGPRPPFLFVAHPRPMPVAGAHVHQRSHRSVEKHLVGLEQGRMKAMVEAHPHQHPAGARRLQHRLQLARATGRRLLDQNMLARLDCGQGHRGQPVVGGRNHHRLHLRPADQIAPIRDRLRPVRDGQGLGAREDRIGTRHQFARAKRLRALAPDEAAAHDSQVQHFSHSLPRSLGTIRRRV